MTYQHWLSHLSDATGPLTAQDVATAAGGAVSPEALATFELVAMLAPELCRQGHGWVLRADTPSRRILSAVRSYVDANPTRTVFRAAAALADLPPHEQPTEEQLRELLQGSSDFKLLPNAMIKRVF